MNEFGSIWKEVTVDYVKLPSEHLSGGTLLAIQYYMCMILQFHMININFSLFRVIRLRVNIVMYRQVAKRWLCKQEPLLGNTRNIHSRNNRNVFSMYVRAEM
jgi:hypothetical protein